MQSNSKINLKKAITNATCLGLSAALLAATGAIYTNPSSTEASSHREAPLISQDAFADTTDVYAFVSPDRQDSVTIIGNWIPFESPDGGPNYYKFADDVLYELHVDNVGDGKAHISYQFQFKTTTKNPLTFLYNTGPVTSLNDSDLNVQTVYSVTEVTRPNGGAESKTVLFSNKQVPPVNIGGKSVPNFKALMDSAIYSNGSGADEVKVYAGQADDPFWVDLGSVFDLLSLRGQAQPIGYPRRTPGVDAVAGYNVHSIALQVPTARLLKGALTGESTIGVWATSSRQTTRVLGALGSMTYSGDYVQVSRLGMPLTNEAVIPLALKDAFNSIPPTVDFPLATGQIAGLEPAGALLLRSVLTPELQTLLGALYGVPNPGKPRADIFDIFLNGMVTAQPFTITTKGGPVGLPAGFNVNRPKSAARQPAEMLRLNTGIKGDLCAPEPQRLGILAGDACGFPNGRRLADDVVEIELLAVAGAAWQPLTNDTSFSFNPALIGVLTDSVDYNDKPFQSTFPYLATPHAGQDFKHASITTTFLPIFNQFAGVGRGY